MFPQNPALVLRTTFVCGLISAALTLAVALIALFRGDFELSGVNVNPYYLFDVIILTGLSIGVFFKSRICATALAVYFVFSKYVHWQNGAGPVISYLVGLFFLYVYVSGAFAAFEYHRQKKVSRKESANQPPTLSPPTATS